MGHEKNRCPFPRREGLYMKVLWAGLGLTEVQCRQSVPTAGCPALRAGVRRHAVFYRVELCVASHRSPAITEPSGEKPSNQDKYLKILVRPLP